LKDLRRWALVVCKGLGNKTIDESIYRSVQPVYIAPPTCIGFKDPFPVRIGCSTNSALQVKVEDLQKLGLTLNHKNVASAASTAALYEEYANTTESAMTSIRKNWLDTIEGRVGSAEHGINEPIYRAAAQMVSEEGSDAVRENIDYYAQAMHRAVWDSIKDKGVRGNAGDHEKYTVDKIRGDIETAVNKDFGNKADKLAGVIDKAVDLAVKNGSPQPLLAREVLRAARQLSEKHFARYMVVRLRVKNEAKGLMSVAAWEKQAKLVGSAESVSVDPNDFTRAIDATLSRVTLLVGQDGLDYLYWVDEHSPTGYQVVKVASPDGGYHIYSLFRKVTGEIPQPMMQKMIISEVQARTSSRRRLSVKEGVLVGHRVISTPETIYYRAGLYQDGDVTIVIDKSGVQYKKSSSLPLYWETTTNYNPVRIPSKDALKEVFGTKNPDFWKVKDFLQTHLNEFIACDRYSIPHVLAVAVSLLVRRPLIYLGLFEGSSGTGKTFGSSVFKQLFDPPGSDTTLDTSHTNMLPWKFEDTHFTYFLENEVSVFDNVENINDSQQMVFSQLSTGSSAVRRIYYSQMNQKMPLYQAVLINCNGNPISRADLASRTVQIHFEKTIKATKVDYNKRFFELAPLLRYCWFLTTSEYLKQRDTLQGISGLDIRDVPVSIISTMCRHDTVTSELVIEEAKGKKIQDVADNQLFHIFVAWLDSHEDVPYVEWSATDRYNRFRQWVRTHNGQDMEYRIFVSGLSMPRFVNINMNEVPDTQRAFDMKIAEARMHIDNMTEWTAEMVRDRGGPRLYRCNHKINSLI